MADTGDKIIRVYSDFRGVDYRGDECALNRSPDALNVWRDYNDLTGIKTRPALKRICSSKTNIKNMKWHGDKLYYYSGKGSYHYVLLNPDGSYDHTADDLFYAGDHGVFFEFQGSLYIMGSNKLFKIEGDGPTDPYIPTTSTSSKPNGEGRQTYQDVNMLTPYRINTFIADGDEDGGGSYIYYLDTKNISTDYEPQVELDGKPIYQGKTLFKTYNISPVKIAYYYSDVDNGDLSDYMVVNFSFGEITIHKDGKPLQKPNTDGQDNVSIKFKKTVTDEKGGDANKRKILGCTIVQEFDNRIFLSGNPDYPNLVFHSSLNNPMYFSDLDVYEDGKDDGYIRAMVSGNDALWVFRNTDKGNGVYYHTASFDSTYGKVYPSVHSNISLGCVGGAINFLDDVVFFSRQGMESISQSITTEQFAKHKSSLVDRVMANKDGYEDMVFAEWEGYLLVFIGTDVFLADSRAVMANEGHYEYEWYHWNLGKYKINCTAVKDGKLYLGTDGENVYDVVEGHIYCLDINGDKDSHADGEVAIESYWTTPKDKFASSNKLKTTNKKGCIVEAEGDLTVSSKVEGGNFDDGEEYTGVEDHIVPKIKRKKFKDIQLKFHSNTKFKLESATLEAFVGSFIKR